MKRSGIDRPGAAGVIRGQSPRKSALSSPRPRLAEATAVRVLSIDTITTAVATAVATAITTAVATAVATAITTAITTAVAVGTLVIGTLAIDIFANSPEIGLLPQRRVRFTAVEEGEFASG